MRFLHLFDGLHFAAESRELGKFLLDGLQPFVSLAVSELSFGSGPAFSSILLVQFLDLSDLRTKTPDLFPKHFQMIHVVRITHLESSVYCRSIDPRFKAGNH